MPEAQQPKGSAIPIEHSTTDLKVYFKLKPSDDWEIDKSLICLVHSKTKGSKIGSAQFVTLMFDNDSTSSDWQEANAAMRYNAAIKYNVDMSLGYKTPYLVKVTDVYDGAETPVWYGYIATVDQEFIGERVGVSGLTYAGLMDRQQILGGWYLNYNNVVDYFLDHIPVYNPKGIGNKSTQSIVTSPYVLYGVDRTLEKDTKSTANLWTAEDMLNQVIGRCENNLFADGGNTFNPYRWAEDLYAGSGTILFYNAAVTTILNASSPVSDYTLQGKTLWQALVEIVESIDGLTISEEMDSNYESYITIVNLKA